MAKDAKERSTFQDDARENAMRDRFELVKDPDQGRSGLDAVLEISGLRIPFELKTTSDSDGSVTTARDFGREHIAKWKDRHWLFGFHGAADGAVYYHYGSPKDMAPWIDKMEKYVAPDYQLAECVAEKLTKADLVKVLGDEPIYGLEAARALQKKQYSIEEYRKHFDVIVFSWECLLRLLKGQKRKPPEVSYLNDLFEKANLVIGSPNYTFQDVVKLLKVQGHKCANDEEWIRGRADITGYSAERMLLMLKERSTYLLERGATLNNPHISGSYFSGWEKIELNHSARLRELVKKYLERDGE